MNSVRGMIVLLAAFLLAGCGSVEVTLKPDTGFTKKASITVEYGGADWGNLQPRIEQALLKVGFDVISPTVAQTRLQYQSNSTNQLSNPASQQIPASNSFQSSSQSVVQYQSVYLLKYTDSFDESLGGMVITEFAASIIDLRTGEVVGTITEGGEYTPSILIQNISDKLSEQLK
jgi:hypothetical protein